jgi:hypothetical protein
LIHISELSKRSAPLNGHLRLLKPKLCKGSNTHMARRISHKASRNNRIYESFTNFTQHKHSNMHYVHHHLLLRHTHAHARAHVHTHTHTFMGISLDFREICLRELAVAARRSRSRALAAKIRSGMVAEAHMDHDSASSIEQLAFCACNKCVLATFAVQTLSTPARAAGGMHWWRRATKVVEAGRLAGRLLPVAVQSLPVVADTGEHRAAGSVLNERPDGHCIP